MGIMGILCSKLPDPRKSILVPSEQALTVKKIERFVPHMQVLFGFFKAIAKSLLLNTLSIAKTNMLSFGINESYFL